MRELDVLDRSMLEVSIASPRRVSLSSSQLKLDQCAALVSYCFFEVSKLEFPLYWYVLLRWTPQVTMCFNTRETITIHNKLQYIYRTR